jgi:hypothetical protein
MPRHTDGRLERLDNLKAVDWLTKSHSSPIRLESSPAKSLRMRINVEFFEDLRF